MGIEELRDLIERLKADASSITDEQLAAANTAIDELRDGLRDQDLSREVIDALTELRDHRVAVHAERESRSAAAAELDAERQGLLGELDTGNAGTDQSGSEGDAELGEGQSAGEGSEGSGQLDPAAGGDAGGSDGGSDAGAAGTEGTGQPAAGDGVGAIAASGNQQAPRRAALGTFRRKPAVAAPSGDLVVRASVTAHGGAPGYPQGKLITSTADLANAFSARLRTTGSGEKAYVAHLEWAYPEARTLLAEDWVGNFTKIEKTTDPVALVAAGGLCAPLTPVYDVRVFGSASRPIRDSLPRFMVPRGGIQFRPHSSAASALVGGTGTGVGTWTMEQDSAGLDRKGCYVVDCPPLRDAVVQAIYLCLTFSNVTTRYDPETTAANVREGIIAHARKSENELLRQIQEDAIVQTADQDLGATRDLLANLDKASAYYRNRHRIDTDLSLTCIMPAWVLFMLRTDICRQMPAGDWIESMALTDQQIGGWFQRRGIQPVWHLDGGFGGTNEVQTITVTGGPTSGNYILSYRGFATDPIPFNATAAVVRDALYELESVNVGEIAVGGGPHPGTPITVAFGGQDEGHDVPLMTVTHTLAGGTAPNVAVATTTTASPVTVVDGVSIASQVYAQAVSGQALKRYPTQVDAMLFAAGSMLYLDGGTFDAGVFRDQELIRKNQYGQFSETFEGIANREIEALRLVMELTPTGQVAGTVDTTAIDS